METWVILSLFAAFLQNLRTALQKKLTGHVGVHGATFARFVFAAPWAMLSVPLVMAYTGSELPEVSMVFIGWTIAGGLSQIWATLLLLHLFSMRNFAVGNTFAKTQTVQAALIGFFALGDVLSFAAISGIMVSLGGVILLSAQSARIGSVFNRAAGIGIACGAFFAIAGVAYRGAGLALTGDAGFVLRAAFTLACVTVFQTLLMSVQLCIRGPGTILAVFSQWRIASPVGLSGMLASWGWFAAYGLASAAEVNAVGQIELVFSWLTARFMFGDTPDRRENLGIILVTAGIMLLILYA